VPEQRDSGLGQPLEAGAAGGEKGVHVADQLAIVEEEVGQAEQRGVRPETFGEKGFQPLEAT
jgi:hypothetical protein